MSRSELVMIGVDHHQQRWCSRLALTETAVDRLLGVVAADSAVEEAAALYTCNRVELYGVAAADTLRAHLMVAAGMKLVERPSIVTRTGAEALRHLARVAGGLESLVIGETEILGQVAAALERAQAAGSAGPVIVEMFRTAVRAGKRARTETVISHHALSIGGLAVRHAASLVGDLGRRRIVMVGTGAGSQQVLGSLPAAARDTLTIVSRDRSRADAAAERWGGRSALRSDLQRVLAEAEVAFTATDGADLITAKMLQGGTGGHSLVIVDIAAPPNVALDAVEAPGTTVVGMADLDAAADQALACRERERPAVESIVAEEVAAFERWTDQQQATPLVKALHQRAEQMRRRLVATACEQIGDLDEDTRECIDRMTRILVNSLLHEPTARIRSASTDGTWEEYERVARNLFDLR